MQRLPWCACGSGHLLHRIAIFILAFISSFVFLGTSITVFIIFSLKTFSVCITLKLYLRSWYSQEGNSQKILYFVQLCSFSWNPGIWNSTSIITLGNLGVASDNISPEILRGGPTCMLCPLRKATLLALKHWFQGKNRRWELN